MVDVRCLHRGWRDALVDLIASARHELVIAAPFITRDGTELISEHLPAAVYESGGVQMVTDLSPAHVCDGSLDTDALAEMSSTVPCCSIWHVPRLHAKLYVADSERAILTSGNLTAGAFFRNVEYGVEISNTSLVQSIRADVADIQSLGTIIPGDAMRNYADAARLIRNTFIRQRTKVEPGLKHAFDAAVQNAQDKLIRLRLAGGAMHTVFAKTIELLLTRRGPLPTTTIHGLVQQLHPDLCDDSIDRVIDGKRFGKKWKHAVRSAQQQLKKRGIVVYDGKVWRRTSPTGIAP